MLLASCLVVGAASGAPSVRFAPPVRVAGGTTPISVEAPGYACPCFQDLDGDGNKDLIVGQFAGGKLATYKNLGGGKFGERQWLQAGGKVAEVPGVW